MLYLDEIAIYYEWMHTHIDNSECTYVCMHVCMYACMYLFTNIPVEQSSSTRHDDSFGKGIKIA